jgi:hypothetical protein
LQRVIACCSVLQPCRDGMCRPTPYLYVCVRGCEDMYIGQLLEN